MKIRIESTNLARKPYFVYRKRGSDVISITRDENFLGKFRTEQEAISYAEENAPAQIFYKYQYSFDTSDFEFMSIWNTSDGYLPGYDKLKEDGLL